ESSLNSALSVFQDMCIFRGSDCLQTTRSSELEVFRI
ncbi:hypothetical protein A2U01_0108326, partial [Trifolium medium]|nr:hypothetical protein [Trifolium medium]